MKLAIFDFDGTITKRDSLLEFIKFAVGYKRFVLGLLVLSPILFSYKLKIIANDTAKQYLFSWYFKGMKQESFIKIADEYSLYEINKIVRQKALDRIEWHKKEGHTIVVVSASLECWLRPWCEKNGLELIGTKMKIDNDIVVGTFLTKNCYGKEKVHRIKEQYILEEYEYIYAYGDSKGDKDILDIAHEKYYKPFR